MGLREQRAADFAAVMAWYETPDYEQELIKAKVRDREWDVSEYFEWITREATAIRGGQARRI